MPRRDGCGGRPAVPALVLAVAAACAGPQEVPLPEADLSAAQPQVVAAVEEARRAVLAAPREAAAWGRLGMVYDAHGLFPPAVTAYRRAAALDDRDYRWPYLAGRALGGGDREAALVELARAAALAPASAAFCVYYGQQLLEAEHRDGAAAQFRRALALDPRSAHAHYGLGQLALLGGDVAGARRELEAALADLPTFREAHTLLAQVANRLGDAALAERHALLAANFPHSSAPADPVVDEMLSHGVSSGACSRRGLELAAAGRHAEAEKQFRRAVAAAPDNARAYANLGAALAAQGRTDEAIAQYETALEVDPEETYALNNLALALAARGDLAAAEARFAEALRLDPNYVDAQVNLGLLRLRQGRAGAAAEWFGRALELRPGDLRALGGLGQAQATSGDLAAATATWRRLLDLDPGQLGALSNLAGALIAQRRHGEAVALLEQGLGRAPNSSLLVRLLAWELATAPEAALRDGRRAVALAMRVVRAYPREPAAADALAAAQAEIGDFAAAVGTAERALELARAQGGGGAAAQIAARLDLYRAGRPYRQPAAAHRGPAQQ